MRKPTICICENKDADQLRGNSEADQCLCFRYSDSTIPPLLNSKISSFQLFSVLVQVGLCWTCSETTLLVFPRGGSIIAIFYFQAACLSRDGQYMMMGGASGVVEVWRTHDLTLLYTYPQCDSAICSICLSHDHK